MKFNTTFSGRLKGAESASQCAALVLATAPRPLLPIEFQHFAARKGWQVGRQYAQRLLRELVWEGTAHEVGDGSYELDRGWLDDRLRQLLS